MAFLKLIIELKVVFILKKICSFLEGLHVSSWRLRGGGGGGVRDGPGLEGGGGGMEKTRGAKQLDDFQRSLWKSFKCFLFVR